ncbi:MAG: hypothetical protein MJ252_13135 [archaeon]|nr:hypothetical protein [archaeon]
MSLRKERIHESGFANFDFRSKRDHKNLQIFQPWKIASHYGTMNDYGFKLPWDERKRRMEICKELNTIKNLNEEVPDPKVYQSAIFYKRNNIKINERQIYTLDRLAQLDESGKGKEIYVGDSMMIADINKMRKERKKGRKLKNKEQLRKEELKENIIKEKDMKNKEATQETQLVKIEASKTLEGKVDIKKILEIRLALRRRYANRKNFDAIFKQWKTTESEITVADAHKMINALSIPININETRALIASANKRGTEGLNLNEFMDLIFSDNEALNLDLSQLQLGEGKIYSEGEQTEDLKKKMRLQLIEKNKADDLKFIDFFFKVKKPSFIAKVKEIMGDKYNASENFCDFATFNAVMLKFDLPTKYLDNSLITSIYEKYKDPEKNQMNYMAFLDHCMNLKEENNFFDFQSKYINLYEDKVKSFEKAAEEKKKYLNQNNEMIKEWKETYERQIEEYKDKRRNERKEFLLQSSFSHYQPSTEFLNLIFSEREKHFNTLNEAEKKFEPSLSYSGIDQRKTRRGGNPPLKNTFDNIKADPKSGSYLPDSEVFKSYCLTESDEKKMASLNRNQKNKSIKEAFDRYSGLNAFHENVYFSKKCLSDYFKSQRQLKYQQVNQERNNILE